MVRNRPMPEVGSRVPQGSVLGPTLFDFFIDDIDFVTTMIDILKKFADDTKLGKVIRSEADRDALQQCLYRSMDWAEKWGMRFNKSCTAVTITQATATTWEIKIWKRRV